MAENDISNIPLMRAADKVRERRKVERAAAAQAADTPMLVQPTTSAQIRARLNVMPDDASLHDMIGKALTALSRGVRWARGSILNLLV